MTSSPFDDDTVIIYDLTTSGRRRRRDPYRESRITAYRQTARRAFEQRWLELLGDLDIEVPKSYVEAELALSGEAVTPARRDRRHERSGQAERRRPVVFPTESRRRELLRLARLMEQAPGGTSPSAARIVNKSRPI